uniref:Lipin_N domain-containing protein n=1 Tax=Macrostomum lignano TaxID=282301 RepID=A0A1I8I1D6_9PLAT
RAGDLQNCSAQPWRKNLLDFFFYNCCEINSENFLCSLLMNLVSQLLGHVGGYWNPSTLSGAIDVLVVEQPDGSLIGSPFHARFGKRGVLRPRDNAVEIFVNESPVTGLAARLGPAGEVIFCASRCRFRRIRRLWAPDSTTGWTFRPRPPYQTSRSIPATSASRRRRQAKEPPT